MLYEDDGATFETALADANGWFISAVNYWECAVRADIKFGGRGDALVDALCSRMKIEIEAADESLARGAADAFKRFKGRLGGRLNMGDCFAYALAAREGDGLLYKGDGFPKTDVRSVI